MQDERSLINHESRSRDTLPHCTLLQRRESIAYQLNMKLKIPEAFCTSPGHQPSPTLCDHEHRLATQSFRAGSYLQRM